MRTTRCIKLLVAGVWILLLVFSLAPVGAASANISHSYKSQATITPGSLVSLDSKVPDNVQAATTSNGQQLLGIAVAPNDSLLAVDASNDLVQVATSGTANVLVSTLNGAINVGDQVSVSPFSGVGMKAIPGSRVIGLAQTSFNTNPSGAISQPIMDKTGKTSQLQIGYVRLSIAIGTASTQGSDANLNSLQKLAKSYTGHMVSTLRIVVSVAVAVVALTALITLIYASIYGSIISIGRNPLAKYAIFRSLTSVVGMAVLTAVIAGGTIFLLLR